jgi:hypothetical protein
MHSTSSSHSSLPASLGFAALGLLSLGLAVAPARAQTQDLFVPNLYGGTISRFAGTGPGTFSTTAIPLSGGLSYPAGLAFDSRGNLFVANSAGSDSITEFAFTPGAGATPGTFGTATMLTGGGLAEPNGLAFDASGNLFTSNLLGTTITEFAFNSNTGTFGTGVAAATGLNSPAGLAFDAQGDLFVGSFYGGTITKLAAGATPGTFRTGTVVATDLNGPVFLSFGLLPSAPVPESSTTVSLGLLLALGMGGMVVAARKRRKA